MSAASEDEEDLLPQSGCPNRCKLKWDIETLLQRLRRVCIIQATVNFIYFAYYIATESLFTISSILVIIAMCISVCLGTWGFFAARAKSRVRLVIYLLTTVLTSSVLLSANITVSYTLSQSCNIRQSAYIDCENLACAQNSTCTIDDLKDTSCEANPTEICDHDYSRNIFAICLQLFAATLPSCFAFISIVRIQKHEEDTAATYGRLPRFDVKMAEGDAPFLKDGKKK